MSKLSKVLILGTDARVVLAVVRSLGRQKIEVHLGWCPPASLALRSKYVRQVHHIPPYRPGDDRWKAALIELLQRKQFDLVIPCNDSTLVPLQRNRAEFEKLARIYLLSDRAFEVTTDKIKSYEFARSLGVCAPRSCLATRSSDVTAILETVKLPVVVKPRSTVTMENVYDARYVRKAETAAELAACLESLPVGQASSLAQDKRGRLSYDDEEVLVQELFRGTGVGVELLAREGEILTAFQHVRIHETMEGGSSYRRSAPLHPELLEAARRLMRGLDYTGVAMVELIFNFQTGQWVFLEINGRFWGSLPLAVAAGADFPYYLYQLLVEGKREFPQTYRRNVRCRNLLLDYRQMKSRCHGQSKLRSLVGMVPDMLRLVTGRDHIDSLTLDDPRPGLAEIGYLVRTFAEKLGHKLRLPFPAKSECPM